MPVLVDYRCTGCGAVAGHWAPSPPEPGATCPACGGTARRVFGFGVGGRASAPAVPDLRSAGTAACRGNPDVPLLCHIDPAAAPGWIARYRGDNRALDAHAERIEKTPPAASAPGTHAHSHAHHHHHGRGSAGAGPAPA